VRRAWLAVLLPLVAAACGEEAPTGVGAGLLPVEAIRTFEIILEPQQYLVWDTTFGQYTATQDAEYHVIANAFEGVLHARGLSRFEGPRTITVTDTLGVVRQDTTPQWVGGRLRVVVDSARSEGGPVQLALYRTGQAWDPSATWTLAVDTLGERVPWTQPGGTVGALVDTATWVPAGTRWSSDSTRLRRRTGRQPNPARGALLRHGDAGRPRVHGHAVARGRGAQQHEPGHRRTSWTPAWPAPRSCLRRSHRPHRRSCASGERRAGARSSGSRSVSTHCRCRARACRTAGSAWARRPSTMPCCSCSRYPSPFGMRPEAALNVGAYLFLPSDQVPLARSPLGDVISATPVEVTSFMAPGAPVVEVGITEFVQANALPPGDHGFFVPRYLALVQYQQRTFGFGSFAPMPRMRLIVSIARELQLP
jgi:hypothetical protein